MKFHLALLALLTLTAAADLPQMSDKTRWLGYFVGWEEKDFDYGFGADGKAIMHYVNKGEPASHTDFTVKLNLQEKIKNRWVTRKLVEDGLATNDLASLDPKKPVTHTMTVTGDTKVEVIQTLSKGRIIIKPKILEKKTENEVRFTMTFGVPNFFRHTKAETEKEFKKLMRSDYIAMRRADNGKKVKIKLYEKGIDLSSDKMIPKGASEFEFSSKRMGGKSYTLEQGSEKVGVFQVEQRQNFYEGLKIEWIPDQEKLGGKDAYVSFAIN
ncbi:MAG: hypothetical protein ACON5H_01185 [Akkermansiaceae bacterium]